MKRKATGPRVFLSSTFKDADLARDIRRRLRAAGLSVSEVAKDTSPSELLATVRKAISHADAVLMLVSPAAVKSPWTMHELGWAEGFNKTVLPVFVGVQPAEVPAPLQDYQMLPYDQLDAAIQKLAKSLSKRKGRESVST
jgi:hypothetical protein